MFSKSKPKYALRNKNNLHGKIKENVKVLRKKLKKSVCFFGEKKT